MYYVGYCCPTGNNQQHHQSQHDVHEDLTEVWSVGRQPSKHCLRPGVLHRASPNQGTHTQAHMHAGLLRFRLISWKLRHDVTSQWNFQSWFYNWIVSTRQDKFCWVVLMYITTVEDRQDTWERHRSSAAAAEMHDNWLIMCNIGISGQMKSDKRFNLRPQWQQQIIGLRGWQENIGDKRQAKSGFQKVFQIELETE